MYELSKVNLRLCIFSVPLCVTNEADNRKRDDRSMVFCVCALFYSSGNVWTLEHG
jgi:hypothetical protein